MKSIAFAVSISIVIFITFLSWRDEVESPLYTVHRHITALMKKARGEDQLGKYDKTFAALIMTEECVPNYYLQDFVFGKSDDRDVYVLSFKKACKSVMPAHVKHLFRPGTTWTTGRNALYYTVRDSGKRYRFHIFMDDDVLLYYSQYLVDYAKIVGEPYPSQALFDKFYRRTELYRATEEIRNNMSAWRFLEKTLLTYSPAYSVVNLAFTETRLISKKRWPRVCGNDTEMPWVTPSLFVDTNLIAFHTDALPYFFPHSTVGQNISWFLSAVYLMQRARALFYRQCIAIWSLSVVNKDHRPYPRNPFPPNYLDLYWNTTEGDKIRDLIDIRERDFVMFYGPGEKWMDVYLGDRSMCTTPLKFPIKEHYQIMDD